jgi:hypothetical protein
MRVWWLPTVAGVTACAPLPGPPVPDPLLVVDRSTGHVATTPEAPMPFVIDFARDGVRMPQSLQIGGIERLGMGNCPHESGIGIGIYPAANAVAPSFGGAIGSSTLEVRREGPVVAEVRVGWTAQYSCPGTQQASGTTTFAIFPNGRIVRHDVAKPSNATLTDQVTCGCGMAGQFYFTTFWTFAAGSQRDVKVDGTPYADGEPKGCVMYPNHSIGVSWGADTTRLTTEGGLSAYVFDWVNSAPTMPPDEKFTTSAIMLSAQTEPAKCSDVVAALADPGLFAGSAAIDSDDLGVHVVPGHQEAPVVIKPRGERLPSFALAIDVGDFAELSRTPELDGDWYFFQPDGDRTLFWFPNGLGLGESITIDPR